MRCSSRCSAWGAGLLWTFTQTNAKAIIFAQGYFSYSTGSGVLEAVRAKSRKSIENSKGLKAPRVRLRYMTRPRKFLSPCSEMSINISKGTTPQEHRAKSTVETVTFALSYRANFPKTIGIIFAGSEDMTVTLIDFERAHLSQTGIQCLDTGPRYDVLQNKYTAYQIEPCSENLCRMDFTQRWKAAPY